MVSSKILKDDPSILDEELLYRSIPSDFVKPENNISSAAYKGNNKNPHISVDRSTLSTKEETFNRHPGHAGVVQLLTGSVRGLSLEVAYTPKKPENIAHSEIIRDFTLSKNQWIKKARELAKISKWSIVPSPELAKNRR